MLPLTFGIISIDSIELFDIDSGEIFSLREPCLVSVQQQPQDPNEKIDAEDADCNMKSDSLSTFTGDGGTTTSSRSSGGKSRNNSVVQHGTTSGSGKSTGEDHEEFVQHLMERRKSRTSFSMDDV